MVTIYNMSKQTVHRKYVQLTACQLNFNKANFKTVHQKSLQIINAGRVWEEKGNPPTLLVGM